MLFKLFFYKKLKEICRQIVKNKLFIFLMYGALLCYCSKVYAQEDNAPFVESSIFTSYSTDNELKLISETTGIGRNYVGYVYIELGATPFTDLNNNWAYTQIFWEQKFWDQPIFIHLEYRALLTKSYENDFYLGLAYTYTSDKGFLALEPLYRYGPNAGHGAQLSVVGGWEWKYVSLAHFTDLYWTSKMTTPLTMYNECRCFFKICPKFYVGAIGIMAYSFQRKMDMLSASVAIKLNL